MIGEEGGHTEGSNPASRIGGVAIDGQTILFLKKTGHLGSCTAPALVRSLGSQVVHPVWCGPEIPTLDLVYKACNCDVHVYRHSGRVA